MIIDKSAAAIRKILKKYDEMPYSDISSCLSDLTALISEHYVAKEEVDKMVSERLREELVKYDAWSYASDVNDVDEYLETRESHD